MRPFTTAQFLQHGSYEELRRRVRDGDVRRVTKGVYLPAGAPDDIVTRLQVAALVLPEGGVLARRGAAWAYGIDARPPGTEREALVLEVAVPRGVQPVRRAGLRCFVEDLAAGDVHRLDGVPVTTPLRTAADLARWLPRPDALAALDALSRSGALDRTGLARELDRWTGYAHVRQARELAALVEPRSESWGESTTRLRLHDAGFPAPAAQVEVIVGRRRFRLDLAWTRLRKALEYDGQEWHSSAKQRRRDEERRRLLGSVGWEVAVVTKEHVLGRGRHFEEVVARLLGVVPERLAS
ncbi:hypothetical protein EV189_1197 [Motilibacter rhizosphaerae]|uniref:AbiEi antitoxin N-terminal domain-containing protein n=1 Tax=Motilibacter rhizosphaerae TaxID=598652 RepID=A0A4Q7NRB0_9ACTN|nr:type IV toxin-antitoxin system AbiEi family antitoxin domain-containing protein [Motilibacter rhizosphaerae]RZS89434.1 hypothetical protein EV189_1197 [Motilibacter rhizosphaerae]